ncbi:toll/interleukin-1 receptor domain-containing protein [Actinoplanes bogorensis]|uniref:Toll/interleukin-1 receptor domain-containing protein n=1 Tax=Paractinoplanes bogorensis TaxID=1610840 RepID=A0ABS5YPX7_9ACTN|nr:toll/interleukin-1 receptor domain-containing protein [Actinoplanes bogorensis]MBU2665121.1 toll/interleukin-1 receptor domain-containing protein [Actinoplanes bogorensis]
MYDVFLSFTRKGHPAVADVSFQRLTEAGLRVYRDTANQPGDSISDEIVTALRKSRLVVVVYSAAYSRRWAGQWEFIQAYLAGAAEGDATRRLLIINPEPDDQHIVPYAASDMMMLPAADLARLPDLVREKLDRLGTATMSGIRRFTQTQWLPPTIPGSFGHLGRFGDLWRVHNALTGVERPLKIKTRSGPAALVSGMAGIGKTSLVRAFAWTFEAAHRGGVHWTSVGGDGGVDAAVARFHVQVRRLADAMGVPSTGESDDRVAVLVADHLDKGGQPHLWVVDDLPVDLGHGDLDRFVVPGSLARHVFITRRAGLGAGLATVPLTGLGETDGLALLHEARPITGADRRAATSIIERLDGHPLALRAVARRLRQTMGLLSYAELDARLDTLGAGDAVGAAIRESVRSLPPIERMVIGVAAMLAPAPAPARLLGDVIASLRNEPDLAVADGLDDLRRHGFVSGDNDRWQVHPLVVEAAAALGPPPVPATRIGAAAATILIDRLADAHAHPAETSLLVRHAEAVASRPELTGTGLAEGLRRPVARHHDRAGDPARAAAVWRAVAAADPGSAADHADAALACVSNGEFAVAATLANQAIMLGGPADVSGRARWALAAALDGLGRYLDAEPVWAVLEAIRWQPESGRRIVFAVSRARSLAAQGRLRSALELLEPLSRPDPQASTVDPDQLNAARIETARLLLLTSSERQAREMAETVVAYYRDRDATSHIRCLEAELVWAEAAVALALFELRSDTSRWREAELLLADTEQRFREVAGHESVFGPAAAVQRGLVLARLGKQSEARAVLTPALNEIAALLSDRHPLHLRGRYALALTYLQLNEHRVAAGQLAEVWRAQCEVVGPGHPDTLNTQLEFAISARYSGSPEWKSLLDGVWSRLPGEIGRENDLYGRTLVAKGLLPVIPTAAVKFLNKIEIKRKKLRGE